MENKIAPSVGRIVRAYFTDTDGNVVEECAAIIAKVWSHHCVNLCVIRDNGNVSSATSVCRKGGAVASNLTWEFPSY